MLIRHCYQSHCEIVSRNTISTVFIELNAEFTAQFTQVIELRVANVVTQQHQYSTRLDPASYSFDVGLFNVMWLRGLVLRIRVNDNINRRIP